MSTVTGSRPTKADVSKRKGADYKVKSLAPAMYVKDVDLQKRIVTGIYNTFNFFDSDGDVLLPGCAVKSIDERGPNSTSVAKIKHLFAHDWTKLPGKIQVLDERTITVGGRAVKGIYFETKMIDTTLGNDTLIGYQEGVYDNHSIGFQYLQGEYIDSEADNWDRIANSLINPQDMKDAGYAFLWSEIKLYEGSTVAFGANQLTPYLGVKDANNKDLVIIKLNERLTLLEKQLQVGTQSDETLQSFEMQCKQLKQLFAELYTVGPSTKSTSILAHGKKPQKEDNADMIKCASCAKCYSKEDSEENEDGSYNCPDCDLPNFPDDYGKSESIFSNLQFQ